MRYALVLLLLNLTACPWGVNATKYSAGREACLSASATCEAYAACVDRIALQTGGPKALPCKASDAGVE